MKNYKTYIFFLIPVLILAAAFILSLQGRYAEAQDSTLNAAQKAEIQKIVHDYLMENGQVIMDSVAQYQQRQEQEQATMAQQKIGAMTAFLEDKSAPSVGSMDADVVIAEFFDFNCGYCKRALEDILKVVDVDKNVRFVFHEMPILGPTSLTAAKWAMAAHQQGKYFEYHKALMNHNGQKSDDVLAQIAKDVGLDVEKAKAAVQSTEVMAAIDKSLTAAREIGINGTPAFIINGELKPGYLGPDGLKQAIAEARKKGKT